MRKLLIDTGHSAKYPGATGEVEWVRTIAAKLYPLLDTTYWEVVKVPDSYPNENSKTTLVKRIAWVNANSSQSDFLVSIHANSAENKNARGVTTCYYSGSQISQDYALRLSRAYSKATGIPLFNGGTMGDQDSRFGKDGLGMIRRTTPFALLIETGFVTSKDDMSISTDLAAQGIANFLNSLNVMPNTPQDIPAPSPVVDTELQDTLNKLNKRGVIKDISKPSRYVTLAEVALMIERNNTLPQ